MRFLSAEFEVEINDVFLSFFFFGIKVILFVCV